MLSHRCVTFRIPLSRGKVVLICNSMIKLNGKERACETELVIAVFNQSINQSNLFTLGVDGG